MPPWSDLVVLLGILVSTAWWMVRLRWRGLRGGRYTAASAVAFLGLALIATMAAHCIDVLSRLLIGTGHDGGAFVYDFRVYSLMLLGVVLIVCGGWLLRVSLRLGDASRKARAEAGSAILAVLALVSPLIPIQGFFAIPLSLIAGVALLLVVSQVRPAAGAAPGLASVATLPR